MELPIFPLNTVLFPGANLPLHIFEERYKIMIGRCIETKSPFGVCLIQKGAEFGGDAQPFRTGTTAHITGVQHLDDGRMNITCVGGNRFTLTEIKETTPFLIADVEVQGIAPELDPAIEEITSTATGLFAEYVRLNLAVANQWARNIELPTDPAGLSDYIAARLAVDAWAKQRLLEEPSPRLRLQVEIEIIAGLLRQLTQAVQVSRTNRWQGFSVLN